MDRPRERPRHREAYPRFNVVQAYAASRRMNDNPVCVFTQNGYTLGQLIVDEITPDSMTILYFLCGKYLRHGQYSEEIKTKPAPSGVDKARCSLTCPGCLSSTFNVYYVDRWACARCHRLTYRSKLISSDIRLFHRRDDLKRLVGRGRPKHMRATTYEKLALELEHAERFIAGRVYLANDVHSIGTEDKWVRPREVGELLIQGYMVLNGDLVETGELS
jgi:ribosomal protein S27AE